MIELDKALYYFDEREADRRTKIVEKHLVYPFTGIGYEAGKPFRLLDWQIPHLRHYWGWKHKSDHTRVVREVFWFTPKKNGKTAAGAFNALTLLLLEDEPKQNIISIAASSDQASLCFDTAVGMVQQSPTLSEWIYDGRIIIRKRSIEIPETGSKYKVMSSSTNSIHGPSISALFFDELHAQKNRQLYDAVKGAGKSRRQPIKFYMTTAGYDRTSICYQLYEYACKVRDGIVNDPSFYPIIYECPRDKEGNYLDWTLESTARAANPSFDLLNKREWDAELAQAKEMPASENGFKQLALNIWTNQSTRWMPHEVWDKCRTETSFKDLIEQCKGRRAYGGLDLAPVNDTSSLVLLIPNDDGTFYVLCWIWIPTDNATMREHKDRVPYSTWIREGFVRTTPGDTTDYEAIYADIKSILEQFNVVEVGFDNAYVSTVAQWIARDFGDSVPVQISQSYDSISPAISEVERLIRKGNLIVPKHDALDWMISNAEVKQNSGGQKILNKSSYVNRIDAVAALVMAMKRASVHSDTDAGGESMYETQSITVF